MDGKLPCAKTNTGKPARRRRVNKAAVSTAEHVGRLLAAAMQIEVPELLDIVQLAHQCDITQISDPPEPFTISRQALRMFWHFRCNLESVEVNRSNG